MTWDLRRANFSHLGAVAIEFSAFSRHAVCLKRFAWSGQQNQLAPVCESLTFFTKTIALNMGLMGLVIAYNDWCYPF